MVGILKIDYSLPPNELLIEDILKNEINKTKESKSRLMIPKLKTIDFNEIKSIHVFKEEIIGETVINLINDTLIKNSIPPNEIGLLIDYSTVSKAENGLSMVYKVQSKIGATQALPIDLGNGSCSSFHLSLKIAKMYLECNVNVKYAILFAEDRVRGSRVYYPSNIVGDGASVVVLKRDINDNIICDSEILALGQFHGVMGINVEDNFNSVEFERYIIPMHYKVIKDLVNKILIRNDITIDDISYVIYQNMNLNDYEGLIKTLGIEIDKVYTGGLRGSGHIFGSDIPINYVKAIEENHLKKGNILMISSGAGYLWGGTYIKSKMFD